MSKKTVNLLYAGTGMKLHVPESAAVLEAQHIPALKEPEKAVIEALENPIKSASLRTLIEAKNPHTVAITISDITRPVPNRVFLPPLLEYLGRCGIRDDRIVIIVGTGMHRQSTPEERDILVGREIPLQFEVIDHRADDPETLVRVSDDPPVSVCRRFVETDFKIVTGYIEAHFMAGFSGGRKGVCPALVDLETIRRFHGFETLADPRADNGRLEGNPCHEIALSAAKTVGVDFLFNVAINGERSMAGIYCGDLEAAHLDGCSQVAAWTTARFERPFDLVITNGGGYPLDMTFYQTVKGMCTALPALNKGSTLLQVSHCGEEIGSKSYTDMMLSYSNDWQRFLSDIEAGKKQTKLDQWQLQMQCRVLERIGQENLWFVSDGIPEDIQNRICVKPILGRGNARQRAQRTIDEYVAAHPSARIAVIPDGPYTMLRSKDGKGYTG